MIRTLAGVALVYGLLYLAFKWGQATEIIRMRDEMLDEREQRTEGSRAPGASRSSSVYDVEADSDKYGLYLLLRGRAVNR